MMGKRKRLLRNYMFFGSRSNLIGIAYGLIIVLELLRALLATSHMQTIMKNLTRNDLFSIVSIGTTAVGIIASIVIAIRTTRKGSAPVELHSYQERCKSARGYVGIIDNKEYSKPYVLSQLLTSDPSANLPVCLSHNGVKDNFPRQEEKPLIEILTANGYFINRISHMEKFLSQISNKFLSTDSFKYIFLTGESGAGKSAFLCSLTVRVKKQYTVFTYDGNDYRNETITATLNELPPEGKIIVIFDQFERFLATGGTDRQFWKAHLDGTHSNAVFIFCCAIPDLGMAMNLLDASNSVYYLSFDECERDSLALLRSRYAFPNNDPRGPILDRIFEKVQDGERPLAALQVIGNLMEEGYIESADTKFFEREGEFIENPEKIVDCYLERWINEFQYPQFGLAILYLLSNGKTFSKQDIQYVSLLGADLFFSPKDQVTAYIQSNKFIEVDGEEFRFKHDYLAGMVRQFCITSPFLSETMQTNIDFYRDQVVHNRMLMENAKRRFQDFVGQDRLKNGNSMNKKLLNFLLVLSMILPVCYTFYKTLDPVITVREHMEQAGIALSCMLSTYYIYSYCMFFTRVYLYSYITLGLAGGLAMWFCFLKPLRWGVYIGVEIIVLAIYNGWVSSKLRDKAKKSFFANMVSFLIFGFFVVLLGVFYDFLHNQARIFCSTSTSLIVGIDVMFFALSIVYLFMSIRTHINVNYIYGCLGMTYMAKTKGGQS